MAIDTPAKLAILGAGPIGLEAALYARFLGYDVVIFEQGRVCEHVRRLSHLRSFVPFGQMSSPLGQAAIEAQNEQIQFPAADEFLTGGDWLARYLEPLAATDLLSDHLRLNTRVLSVGKEQVRKTDRNADLSDGDERGDWSFRLLVQDEQGNERIEEADAVLDCSGIRSQPAWCGHGGLPAIGERQLTSQILHDLPDILGADRAKFVGQRTLLIGHGDSAAQAAVDLHQLAQADAKTQFTWITRHEYQPAGGPLKLSLSSDCPQQLEVAAQANGIALGNHPSSIRWHWGTHVEKIAHDPAGHFTVSLSGQRTGDEPFDQILALVGYRPDTSLFAELQIDLDPITAGLRDHRQNLKLFEDNFYVLGEKSFGRTPGFRFTDGLDQIRRLFALLGDRETLDLYRGGKPQLG
jgi:thioredoxin reductase